MRFRLYPLRFTFAAREPVSFASGSGNILRGAFGTILRSRACDASCPGAPNCEKRASCAYARLFEPSAREKGPSGLRNWPRPFVLRSRSLEGRVIAPGDRFWFDLHLFDTAFPRFVELTATFAEFAREGVGPGRSRADLVDVSLLDVSLLKDAGLPAPSIYDGSSLSLQRGQPLALNLTPAKEDIQRIRVDFLTPTELKTEDQLAVRPEFAVLMNRIRDRVSTLAALYGDGPLPLDFAAFGERAARVQMTSCDLHPVERRRKSSRTGQIHSLGGFTGSAEYSGDLDEFLPFLQAARWIGVGRQTTWGKGEIAVSVLS